MTIKCLVYYFFRRAIPPHYCMLGSKCFTVGILFVMLNGPLQKYNKNDKTNNHYNHLLRCPHMLTWSY